MRKKFQLKTVLLLIMFIFGLPAVLGAEENENPRRVDFQLVDMNGETLKASDWDGKVVVIVFGATWAGPVHQIMKTLINLQEKYFDHGVQFVYFSINDREGAMSDFLKEYKLNFPMILKDGEETAKAYEVNAVPYVIFIDRDGYVRDKIVGVFKSNDRIELALRELL